MKVTEIIQNIFTFYIPFSIANLKIFLKTIKGNCTIKSHAFYMLSCALKEESVTCALTALINIKKVPLY